MSGEGGLRRGHVRGEKGGREQLCVHAEFELQRVREQLVVGVHDRVGLRWWGVHEHRAGVREWVDRVWVLHQPYYPVMHAWDIRSGVRR